MKQQHVTLILFFLALFCLHDGTAQPRVQATLDSTQILIGDHLKMNLSARFAKGTNLAPPNLSFLDSMETIELINISQADTTSNGNEILLNQELTITSFDSGAHFIPAIPFQYTANGRTDTVFTNQILLEVGTPTIDSIPLAPIKWIEEEPFSLQDIYGWLIGVFGILLLGLAIWWFANRRNKKEVPPPPEIIIPAHEIALQKLTALKEQKLWQQGQIKEYHSQLTYILREYLENNFNIQALESTTDEIIPQLKKATFDSAMTEPLRQMLLQADLVKFAKATPSVDIHDEMMNLTESFVLKTKRMVKEAEPESKPASEETTESTEPEESEDSASTNDQQLHGLWITALWSEDMTFVNPEFFLLLLLIPALGAWYYFKHQKRYASLRMPSLDALAGVQSIRGRLRALLPLLRLFSVIALIIALARPQLTLKEEEITADGIDIMLVMDLSSSMLAQDFKPDRLEVSKKVASDFVDKRQYDRIGLAVFAGEAFTQCPLTTDHGVLKEFLANLECGILEDGTAIGMGLATAVNRLKESEAKSKVVILLTDGDNNAGYVKPITAAEIAREFNVKVYTIGIGSRGKALAPVSRRSDGRYIFGLATVQIDEALLQKIADMTSGRYFRATSAEALQQIYEEIDLLEKTEIEVTAIKRYNEEFHVYAFWGLLLLLIEVFLRYTVFRTIP